MISKKQVQMSIWSCIEYPGDNQFVSMDAVNDTLRLAKRIAIGVVGATVLLLGVVMIITPGPALILIPVGLAILGLEFAWARLWLRWLRRRISTRNSRNHGERAEQHRRAHRE